MSTNEHYQSLHKRNEQKAVYLFNLFSLMCLFVPVKDVKRGIVCRSSSMEPY